MKRRRKVYFLGPLLLKRVELRPKVCDVIQHEDLVGCKDPSPIPESLCVPFGYAGDSHITQIHGYDAVHLPRNPGKIRTRRASGGSGDSGVNVRRQKLMACTPSPKKNKKSLSLLEDLSEAVERFPRLRQMKRANKASPGSARNSKSPAQVRRPGPPPILFTSQSDGY